MIFKKQLRWEITNTTGAIFLILLTIIFIFMMIRALDNANSGQISPQDILLLISLSSVIYIPHIVIVSLFIATIMVLTKWYETSEMIIWQNSGLSLIRFLMPLWKVSLPFFILTILLSLIIWPWSNNYIERLKQNFKHRDQLSLLVSGQFFELAKSNKVLFIENLSDINYKKCDDILDKEANKKCKNQSIDIKGIFATSIDNENIDIIVSQSGNMKNEGAFKYANLLNGERYIIQNYNSNNYQIKNIIFDNLNVKMKPNNNSIENINEYPARALSSKYLWENPSKTNLIELSWRIGFPFSLLILQLWALVLSHANPRKGKYFNIALAFVTYIVYNNLIGISKSFMDKKEISILFGGSIIHIIFLLLGILILLYRTYGLYFLYRIFFKHKL